MNTFKLVVRVGIAVLATSVFAAQLPANAVLGPHASELVALKGDALVPFDSNGFLQAPYVILYFGAGWCPDCRHFSPKLVEAYKTQPAGAHRFEVLLLSRDKTSEGMLQFMRSEKMPWPALAFDKVSKAEDLQRFYSGHGIPCLTVIDSSGAIVLQSKDDQDAKEVLESLEQKIAKGTKDNPTKESPNTDR